MVGQKQGAAQRRRRGRPPMGMPADPLTKPLKIFLPVSLLDQVDDYLAAERKANPHPRAVSRSEGIRNLVMLALVTSKAGMGAPFERMPRQMLDDSHALALRLSKSILAGVEEFKEGSLTRLRVVAIQDLLWNGLRIWQAAQKRPSRKGSEGKAA